MKLAVAIAFIFLVLAVLAWAHPFYILCPIDGAQMMFDHQVGYDAHAVCWYSHQAYDENHQPIKHQAYVLCNSE